MIKKKLALFTMLCATVAGNNLQASWQKKAKRTAGTLGGLGASLAFGMACAGIVEYRHKKWYTSQSNNYHEKIQASVDHWYNKQIKKQPSAND